MVSSGSRAVTVRMVPPLYTMGWVATPWPRPPCAGVGLGGRDRGIGPRWEGPGAGGEGRPVLADRARGAGDGPGVGARAAAPEAAATALSAPWRGQLSVGEGRARRPIARHGCGRFRRRSAAADGWHRALRREVAGPGWRRRRGVGGGNPVTRPLGRRGLAARQRAGGARLAGGRYGGMVLRGSEDIRRPTTRRSAAATAPDLPSAFAS